MTTSLPVVLIPGLLCSPRFYAAQIPVLWRSGPVTVVDHTRDDSMAGIAKRILADAPPRFAVAGHSMGGYIAFEILRQAPDRVARLALLDTSARADTPEQTAKRKEQIAQAQAGRFGEVPDALYPNFVHPSRREDAALRATFRAMTEDADADAFVRQLTAIMHRADSLPGLPAIRCPTLVLVGDADVPTPPERAAEIADGIAGAKLVTVPVCGHLSAMEQPEAVTQALEAWLRA
jgi:pimeloyl-ACP methyl ester carboxylesterase